MTKDQKLIERALALFNGPATGLESFGPSQMFGDSRTIRRWRAGGRISKTLRARLEQWVAERELKQAKK